jgi:hypothetical protein
MEDSSWLAGMPTEAGSTSAADYLPVDDGMGEQDEEIVLRRLDDA